MSGHEAKPNSEVSETVTPGAQNATATYPGTRYGKGGSSPAGNQNDSETTKIVTSSPGV